MADTTRNRHGKYKPTLREMEYIQKRVEGLPPRQAALAAGYTKQIGGKDIARLEGHNELATWFRQACADKGITPDTLVQTLQEGLQAMSVKAFKSRTVEEGIDPETGEEYKRTFDTIIHEEFVDHETRHRFMMSGFELMGLNPRMGRSATTVEGPEVPAGSTVNIFQINQDFAGMTEEDLREQMQRRLLNVVGSVLPADIVLDKTLEDAK
jgi:hypothetical protein